MRIIMKIFILISSIMLDCYCYLTQSENDFTSAVSNELSIAHIVMVNRICEIFNKISEVKYYSLKNMYIVYMNFHELDEFLTSKNASNLNLMIIFKIENNEELQSLSKQLSSKSEQMRIFSSFKWLLLLPPRKEITVTEKDFYVPFNCRFFLSRETGNGYGISQIYQIKKTLNMIHTYFGAWNKVHDLNVTAAYFYNERKDEKRTSLTISTYLPGNECKFIVQCIHFQVIHDLASILNFTEVFIFNPEGKIKSDLMAHHQMLNYDNPNTENVVGPVTIARMHFYIQHELSGSHSWLTYLKPFSQNLWLYTVSLLIITTLIKVIIGHFAATTVIVKDYTLLDQGFAPLTIFCNQGINHELKIVSSRISIIFTFIASIIIVSAYSAAVISSLTVQIPKIPFTDFETLIQDGTYKLVSSTPGIESFFAISKDPGIKVVREKYSVPFGKFCIANEDCAELICKKKKLSVAAFNYKLLQYPAKCQIFRIPAKIADFYTAIELKEAISYKRILLETLIKIRSAGFLNRYQDQIFGQTEFPIQENFNSIDINAVKSAFVILLIGFLISWFILLCEVMYYNHN